MILNLNQTTKFSITITELCSNKSLNLKGGKTNLVDDHKNGRPQVAENV